MKPIITILMAMLAISEATMSQAKDTAGAVPPPSTQVEGKAHVGKSTESTERTDAPGDTKRKMDRFIDLDGDGICDQRVEGLGYRRGDMSVKGFREARQLRLRGKQHRGGKQ
jgi:hypothetical protein